MATSGTFTPFLPDPDPVECASRWTAWTTSLEFYFDASEVKTDGRKKALLLHHMGAAAQSIFLTLIRPQLAAQTPPLAETYANIKSAFSSHFEPRINTDFEIYQFRQTRQREGESVDQYATRLRTVAARCSFPNIDAEIKSHIIYSCLDPGLRRHALRDTNLDLQQLLSLARTHEATEQQAKQMEDGLSMLRLSQTADVNHVHTNSQSSSCPNCGTSHSTASMDSCPARGRTCNHCGKINHFAIVCRSRLAGWPPAFMPSNDRDDPVRNHVRRDRPDRDRKEGNRYQDYQRSSGQPSRYHGYRDRRNPRRNDDRRHDSRPSHLPQDRDRSRRNSSPHNRDRSGRNPSPHTSSSSSRSSSRTRHTRHRRNRRSKHAHHISRHRSCSSSSSSSAWSEGDIPAQDNRDRDRGDNAFYVTVNAVRNRNLPRANVCIAGQPVNMVIDTGASLNIVSEGDFSHLAPRPRLHRTNTQIFAYGAQRPIPILGKFKAAVSAVDNSGLVDALFYVAAGDSYTSSLLSFDTAKNTGLVKLHHSVYNSSALPARHRDHHSHIKKTISRPDPVNKPVRQTVSNCPDSVEPVQESPPQRRDKPTSHSTSYADVVKHRTPQRDIKRDQVTTKRAENSRKTRNVSHLKRFSAHQPLRHTHDSDNNTDTDTNQDLPCDKTHDNRINARPNYLDYSHYRYPRRDRRPPNRNT